MAISLYICFPGCGFNSAARQHKWPWLLCLHTKPVDSLCCCYCFCSGQLVNPEHDFLSVSDDARPTSLFCVAHLDNCEHVYVWCVCVPMRVYRLTFWTDFLNWPWNISNSAVNTFLHIMYRTRVQSGRKASVHLTLAHALCLTCSKPMTHSGKKIPLIQIKLLSNHLDAPAAR